MIDDKPVGAALNRNLGTPVAPGEVVEADLNRLIERRARQRDADEESELWQGSVRAYEEKRRQVARLEWHAFHCGQAARHKVVHERYAHCDAEAREDLIGDLLELWDHWRTLDIEEARADRRNLLPPSQRVGGR